MKAVKLIAAALTLSVAGLAGISLHEGRVLHAYKDPVGVVTICDGHTKTAKMGQRVDHATCDRLLKEDTREAQQAVRDLVKVPLTQRQYDELVDFVFNVGVTNFRNSTLLKHINAGRCYAAGAEFPKWDKAKGRVLPGLTKRRLDNRRGWESGCV